MTILNVSEMGKQFGELYVRQVENLFLNQKLQDADGKIVQGDFSLDGSTKSLTDDDFLKTQKNYQEAFTMLDKMDLSNEKLMQFKNAFHSATQAGLSNAMVFLLSANTEEMSRVLSANFQTYLAGVAALTDNQ